MKLGCWQLRHNFSHFKTMYENASKIALNATSRKIQVACPLFVLLHLDVSVFYLDVSEFVEAV